MKNNRDSCKNEMGKFDCPILRIFKRFVASLSFENRCFQDPHHHIKVFKFGVQRMFLSFMLQYDGLSNSYNPSVNSFKIF